MTPSQPQDGYLGEAHALRNRLESLRDGYRSAEVSGTARGGGVVVRMTVAGEFKDVRIDPEVHAEGPEEVAEAVLFALRNAMEQVRDESRVRAGNLKDLLESIGDH